MKLLLLVLVLAAAGAGSYYFYFQDHPFTLVQGPEESKPAEGSGAAPTSTKNFRDLNARLQSDMDHIPTSLHDARQLPTHALDTKSRLAPYLQLHAEYETLTQACDLIIDADQTFLEHQQKCGLAPAALGASALERARIANAASAAGPAFNQQQQTLWDTQRRQSDAKVRQLLATLENKRL